MAPSNGPPSHSRFIPISHPEFLEQDLDSPKPDQDNMATASTWGSVIIRCFEIRSSVGTGQSVKSQHQKPFSGTVGKVPLSRILEFARTIKSQPHGDQNDHLCQVQDSCLISPWFSQLKVLLKHNTMKRGWKRSNTGKNEGRLVAMMGVMTGLPTFYTQNRFSLK